MKQPHGRMSTEWVPPSPLHVHPPHPTTTPNPTTPHPPTDKNWGLNA